MRKTPEPNQFAEPFVRTLLEKKPKLAKEIAEKTGVDFDHMVQGLIITTLDDGTSTLGSERERNINEALSLCKDQNFVRFQFADRPLSDADVKKLLRIIPEALFGRKDEVVKVVCEAKYNGNHVTAQELSVLWPDATEKIVAYLNKNLLTSNPTYKAVHNKIDHLGFGFGPNPGFLPEIWRKFLVYTRCLYNSVGNFDRQTEGMDQLEIENVIAEAAQVLVEKGEAAKAARLALSFNLQGHAHWAAAIAYKKCVDRHQFQGAAVLCETYGMPDIDKAAQKALDSFKDASEAINWALRFGLEVSNDLAEKYAESDNPSIERLLFFGHPKLAKKLIQRELGRIGKPKDLLVYYNHAKGLFTSEEALEDMTSIIAAKLIVSRTFTLAENILEMLPELGLESIGQQLRENTIAEFLSFGPREYVQDYYEMCFPEHPQGFPSLLLLGVATTLAQKGKWAEFWHICREWELKSLENRFSDLTDLLPKPPNPTFSPIECLNDQLRS